MALVQNQGSGHGLDAGDVTFFQMVAEIGMKEALRYRSDGIDGGVMRV